MTTPGRRFGDRFACLLLAAAWAAALALAPPVGEFPTIDDWDYAETVRLSGCVCICGGSPA